MRGLIFAGLMLFGPVAVVTGQAPAAVTTRDIQFYSEAVLVKGKLFLPSGFSTSSKAAAVVLAPGTGETAASVERYASTIAAEGIVALAFDYRGWGKSGAFIYMAEPIRWDDRLRFSQHTAKVRLRRKRLVPEAQVTDIRNAITFVQGEPGVDRARVGVWGTDLGGGHAITVAATDARIKAVVAQAPLIAGHGMKRAAFAPSAQEQAEMVKLARNPAPAVTASTAGTPGDPETKLTLAQYRPFLMLDVVPQTVATLFVIAEKDAAVNNETNAVAASKVLKGTTEVKTIPGSNHLMSGGAADAAAQAAAAWFAKHL
jgi:alpha-beta hydrolase superfamily lysophospholipase